MSSCISALAGGACRKTLLTKQLPEACITCCRPDLTVQGLMAWKLLISRRSYSMMVGFGSCMSEDVNTLFLRTTGKWHWTTQNLCMFNEGAVKALDVLNLPDQPDCKSKCVQAVSTRTCDEVWLHSQESGSWLPVDQSRRTCHLRVGADAKSLKVPSHKQSGKAVFAAQQTKQEGRGYCRVGLPELHSRKSRKKSAARLLSTGKKLVAAERKLLF